MATLNYPDRHRGIVIPTTISPEENVALVRAEGVWVWDENGKKYLDACSQVSCANIGHNHQKFTDLMARFWDAASSGRLMTVTMGTDFFYRNLLAVTSNPYDVCEPVKYIELSPVALAERLAPHLFGTGNTAFGFHVTGAQIVNVAIRFFRTVTKKPYVISFEKAFDGRDGESRDVSASNPIHWDEMPKSGSVFFLPYPETDEDYKRALEMLNDIPLKRCSCMIYEPVQGEGGGMRVGWRLKDLESLLKKEGIFSISDEIQSGLGRCGSWWGYQQIGCDPDAVVMGKSLGSGHPVSAVGFRRDRCDIGAFPQGKVSGTFSMSPVGIAAAIFTMHIYEEERLVEKAAGLAPMLDALLKKAIKPWDEYNGLTPYYRADGIGLYRSIKPFAFDGKHDEEERDRLVLFLRELGVLTIGASKSFPAVRLTPPLVATEDNLNFLSEAIAKAISSK